MKINKNTLFNNVQDMTDYLTEEKYPVIGFDFSYPDLPNYFDPFTRTASDIAGFLHKKGMPEVDGFFYVTNDYSDYVATLQEQKKEHPANTEKLPWITNLTKDEILQM